MRISDWSSDVCSSDLLEKLAGYWPDIEKSRAEARQLFKKAGVDLSKTYVLNNRGVDQPYKIVGTWLIDQFRQVGLNVEQRVQPTGPFYASLRQKKDWDMSIEFNCQSVVSRSEENTSELQSLMSISYAVFCLQKKKPNNSSYLHT